MQDIKLKMAGRNADGSHRLKVEGLPGSPREIHSLRPRLTPRPHIARSGPRMDDGGPPQVGDTISVHTTEDIGIDVLVTAITDQGAFLGAALRFNGRPMIQDVEGDQARRQRDRPERKVHRDDIPRLVTL